MSNMSTTTEASTINASTAGTGTGDDDCGLLGAVADDAEADYVRHVCDTEMITQADHLFRPLLQMVTYVCSDLRRFANSPLQVRLLCVCVCVLGPVQCYLLIRFLALFVCDYKWV